MQKYIINQSKISSKLIKSLNGLKFDQYTNQLIGLEENIDDLLELKDGSDVLVPVFFNNGLEGNYSIESSFIKENLFTTSF